MRNPTRSHAWLKSALAAPLWLCACSQGDQISNDTKPFDGVDQAASIYLSGTEPFWGVEIVTEGRSYIATYSTPDDPEGSTFPVNRFAGNNGLGFSGEWKGEAVQIAVTPGACSDGMSDRTYPYTATIKLGDATLLGCGYTSDEPFEGDEAL